MSFSKNLLRGLIAPTLAPTLAVILLAPPPAPAAAAAKQVIKFASLAPEGTTWMRIMRKLDGDVRRGTGGAVRFRIYPGGVSGNEKDVVRKLRVGQLHAAGFTGVGLGEILPAARLFELPFFFRSYKEVDAVHRELDGWYEKAFREKGYVLLGWSEVGFAHFFSRNPIGSIPDLSKQKVWMWEGDPLARAYFESMGIRAIPLAVTDVLTSLQTGLIDTVYISPLGAIALQWFTKVRYINPVPMVNVTGAIIMSQKRFNRLSPVHQQFLLKRARERMVKLRRLTRRENAQALAAMKKRGLRVSAPPSDAELNVFRKIGQKSEQSVVGKLIPASLLSRARRVLSALRSGKSS